MADRSPASAPLTGDGAATAPRPFDRSLLEATLADATRAVETGDGAEQEPPAPPRLDPPAEPAPSHAPAPVLPVVTLGTPPPSASPQAAGPPVAPSRLRAPGAQALLSAASPVSPVEDRAVDAGRLRVGVAPGLRGGSVDAAPARLPVVGAGGLPSASPAAPVAPPAPRSAPPRPAPAPPAPVAQHGGPPRPKPVADAERPAITPWTPADDDILPTGAARRRARFRLR